MGMWPFKDRFEKRLRAGLDTRYRQIVGVRPKRTTVCAFRVDGRDTAPGDFQTLGLGARTKNYRALAQRCDACKVFGSDPEAGVAFLRWLKR